MKSPALLFLLTLGLSSLLALQGEEPLVIPLWEKGAPGFEDRRNEPEVWKGGTVMNVHNPSLTVYPAPKEKANGTAVLVVPGGGHRQLGFVGEGSDPAKFLNDLGVTAFVLKHRLPREPNSPYSLDIHPRQDAQRAMRIIRTRAAEWNLNPARIGAMGFSAGGETVALLVYSSTEGDPKAADAIDRQGCRTDFQIVIYPGPLGVPAGDVPADAPPAFFVIANDDTSHMAPVLDQLAKYEKAKRPIELHLYAKGGHGFGMGSRSKLAAINAWPQRMADWLADSGLLPKPGGQ